MSTLRDIGEDALVERLLQDVPLGSGSAGPGDDCAVIETTTDHELLQLLKTDAIVSGIHFTADTAAQRVGHKAIARVISDFAAMGGEPDRFLVTIAVDPATPLEWLDGLYQGIGTILREHQALLAGGETTSLPPGSATVISIAATGKVRRQQLTLRSGGRVGDCLLVTGRLGGSLSGKHLDFQPRLAEAAWLTSHHRPQAMMDLSDGLAKDLPRMAAASGCGFRLHREAIPLNPGCTIEQALADGEDYELLMAVDPLRVAEMLNAWAERFPQLPLTAIGELCAPSDGESMSGGWDHFR